MTRMQSSSTDLLHISLEFSMPLFAAAVAAPIRKLCPANFWCAKLAACWASIRDALDGHTSYSGTPLFQTSEMWTPHFNGHFLLRNGLHSHSRLYIITSEMWTSHYSINRAKIFCTKMKYSYKLEQFIGTVSMLVL